MKSIIVLIVVAAIAVGALVLFNNLRKGGEEASSGVEGKGWLFFSITDAAASLEGISEIKMTVDRVEVFSSAQGWVTVNEQDKTFNLLDLRARNEMSLLAQAQVNADTFNRVRVTLADVEVEKKTGAKINASLPSKELVLNAAVKVEPKTTTHVKLDVLADRSLHSSVNGKIVFAPVIQVESRSQATVEVSSENEVSVSGGTMQANVLLGTDVDGTVKEDFSIDSDAKLQIETDGQIKILGQ